MYKNRIVLLLLLFSLSALAQNPKVTYLRCEDRINPLGVDNASPRLSWEIQSAERNVTQKAYHILVADELNLLQKNVGNVWDSKQTLSTQSIQVVYGGKPLISTKTYYWKVMIWDNRNHSSAWSETGFWQMGLLEKQDWKNAQWIGYEQLPDSSKIVPAHHGNGKKTWGLRKDILPLLRTAFQVTKKVKKATIFISGLGHFEMSLNGQKVGDHFLDPGWTKYDKHALYVTFDVTNQLTAGANALGVMLGNGFYYVPSERYRKITGGYGYPKLICRLALEYTDGTSEDIVSNNSWKTAPGPVTFSSIFGGEDYDARLEQTGWDTPAFNADSWKNALVIGGNEALQSQMAEPLKVMETFSPVKTMALKPTVFVYDLGQNASGIPQITVQGNKGDTIKIIPAELLKEDGSANQTATGSPSYFLYVLKGNGPETWQPRFTYYGFRYLQVEGAVPQGNANVSKLPIVLTIKGLHTRNAAYRSGQFSCSNELFNQTDKLIDWAIRSNMASVLTDCPHREKLGWLEEAHLVGSSIRYHYDIAALNRKVIGDMRMAQTPKGLMPAIAPELVEFDEPFRDSPEWGSNCIILPWYNYQWYADRKVLEESYPMMQRYITYLEGTANNFILSQGLGDWYDLGPNPPGKSQFTSKGVTATAIWYYDLQIIAQVAGLLGKSADVKTYQLLAEKVKKAFNAQFFNKETKQYATGSQTANSVAVYMGLVEPQDKEDVINNIVKDIRSRNNALTAGDIGYRYLLRVLDDAGRSDVIYEMNNRNDVPGYGYQLAKGATALTESWQALPNVSNNHFMLGHILEWFYSGLAGIRSAENSVAFNHIEFRPELVGNLTSAQASYRSPYGIIGSQWSKKQNKIEWTVEVPVNAKATVVFPAKTTDLIQEKGKVGTLKGLTSKNGKPALEIGSGKYTFVIKTQP